MTINDIRFSLLRPTRGRPKTFLAAAAHWIGCADNPDLIEAVYAVDDDDRETLEVIRKEWLPARPSMAGAIVVSQAGGRKGVVTAWNAAATIARGKILVAVDDDYFCSKGWDGVLWSSVPDHDEPHLYRGKFKQQCDWRVSPMALNRARYKAQGHVFFPGYHSMYGDTDAWARAELDDVIVECPGWIVEHRHYLFTPGVVVDDTYAYENNPKWMAEGGRLYEERNPGRKANQFHDRKVRVASFTRIQHEETGRMVSWPTDKPVPRGYAQIKEAA